MMGQAWGERALENKKKNTHKFCVQRCVPSIAGSVAPARSVAGRTVTYTAAS